MLQLEKLHLAYSGTVIFNDVNFQFPTKFKAALYGPNGIGKTSLFKILTSQNHVHSGKVIAPKDYKIALLEQDPKVESDLKLIDYCTSAFQELLDLEEQTQSLREDISKKSSTELDDLYKLIEQNTTRLEAEGYYSLETDAKKILSGLGFSDTDFQKALNTFSGGWRIRAYLGKLLLQKPDLLLLDEPTNHLDLEAIIWLESFLKQYSKSVLIVSHDIYFLDRIVDHTIEVFQQKLQQFKGTVSEFNIFKEAELIRLEKENTVTSNQIKHIRKFVDRFRYKASKAKQVQSRIKMLEKLNIHDLDQSKQSVHFDFQTSQSSGKDIFHLNSLTKSFDKPLIGQLSLSVYRGERIAILGPNGEGKSTLLKLLAGELLPDSGEVTTGARVKIGYFAQHQIESLNPDLSILDEVSTVSTEENRVRLRSILGRFLFSGEDINKKISVLSGGEKARVALAKLFAADANTLLLDEPSNHLDMMTKEALLIALQEFNGTLICISHDRSLLDALFDKFYYLNNAKFTEFLGNYEEFIQTLTHDTNHGESNKKDSKNKVNYLAQKEIKNKNKSFQKSISAVEDIMDTLEKKKTELLEQLHQTSEAEELMAIQAEIDQISDDINQKLSDWENINAEYEQWKLSVEQDNEG